MVDEVRITDIPQVPSVTGVNRNEEWNIVNKYMDFLAMP